MTQATVFDQGITSAWADSPVPANAAEWLERAQAVGNLLALDAVERDRANAAPHAEVQPLEDSGLVALLGFHYLWAWAWAVRLVDTRPPTSGQSAPRPPRSRRTPAPNIPFSGHSRSRPPRAVERGHGLKTESGYRAFSCSVTSATDFLASPNSIDVVAA